MTMIQKIILDNDIYHPSENKHLNTLSIYKLFQTDIKTHFIKNKQAIHKQIQILQTKYNQYCMTNTVYKISRYSMQYKICFKETEKKWNNMIKQF